MELGTVCHAVILEGRRLSDVAVAYDESCYRSDGALNGRAAADFREANPGRVVMRLADFARCRSIIEAALTWHNGTLLGLVESTTAKEAVVLGEWEGHPIKCKADLWTGDEVYDLKFVADASPQAFKRQASTLGYWLQDLHYTRCCETKQPLTFIAIETADPFRVAKYKYDRESRALAGYEHTRLLGELAIRRRDHIWEDNWPETMRLRPWEVMQHDEDGDELVTVGDL
jgi:hypothetical protein